MHAGIGGGFFSQGQPVIVKLVEQLALEFDITVYSQLPPNIGVDFKDYKLYSPPGMIKLASLRWLVLMGMINIHQVKRPYKLFYSFWGYPAGFFTVLLGNLWNKPSVIHLQGGDATSIPMFRYGAFYGPVSRGLSTWAYERASLLIALTRFQRNNLEKHGVHRSVEVVPYGPDLNLFTFHKTECLRETIRFIHIGNHSPIKNQKMLLDTFSLICKRINCSLTIIGHDALNGELKNYSKTLGIDNFIKFIEPSPYYEIPNYLSNADVLLHTSLYEAQATVISEAAACGALLAGTRVGLLHDLGDEFGLVVDVGDAEGLAEKVLITLANQNLIETYTTKARTWAEQHDQQYTIKAIRGHLHHLLKNL
jgi:glycosyltransferase involved in cell wall biosynthesis